MELVGIVAMTSAGVIGVKGALPWHLPADLKRFKALTLGHTVVMGRKTYESIGKALVGRRNVILTRKPCAIADCEVYTSKEAVLAALAEASRVFVIGGAQVYGCFLPELQRLYVTLVHQPYAGDCYFPGIPPGTFREVKREDFDEYSYVEWVRVNEKNSD